MLLVVLPCAHTATRHDVCWPVTLHCFCIMPCSNGATQQTQRNAAAINAWESELRRIPGPGSLEEGFECRGSTIVACLFCAAKPCSAPFTIQYGSIKCGGSASFPSGTRCNVACDKGYTPSPPAVACFGGSFEVATCKRAHVGRGVVPDSADSMPVTRVHFLLQ